MDQTPMKSIQCQLSEYLQSDVVFIWSDLIQWILEQ